MYILKNSLISIFRNKGRNILIGLIILTIACASTVTLAIRNTANTIVKSYEESHDLIATISFDRGQLGKNFKGGEGAQKENIETFNNIQSLTIDDVKNNPCVYIDGKFYHDSCWRNYRKLTEVDKFTRRMVGILYKDTDYQFELLPNGYCHEDCCSHIPWFLFHTIDGDIIMGWRKRVISIEWQENYKPFDMNELFSTEDVTKWEKGGKRGIHACGKEKAYEYLKKVLKAVNPEYSKW